jgi:hypothetical protein
MEYKKSLIINTRKYGFFSSVFQVLDNIKYCNENNIKPIIELGNEFKYKNEKNNSWESFFHPINDGVIEGEPIHISQLPNGALYLLKNYILIDPLNDNCKSTLWENIISNPNIADNHRLQINEIINNYLKPSNYIQQTIDNFVKENFTPQTLGVHFRGTDFHFNDINIFISTINTLLEQQDYSKIYIASDNHEAIEIFTNTFPNVCSYNTQYRAPTINSSHPAFHLFSGEDMIKQGQSVLIESILLSKCNQLVCLNSNVAKFAACLNPNMPINLITRLYNQG